MIDLAKPLRGALEKRFAFAAGATAMATSKFTVFSALIGIMASAAAIEPGSSLPPRLLVAEKENRVVFLLPESHVGTPQQNDGYFKEVITKAFAASTKLMVERQDLLLFNAEYRTKSCPNEHSDEASIDKELNEILATLPGPGLAIAGSPNEVSEMSRFARFHTLFYGIPSAWNPIKISKGHRVPIGTVLVPAAQSAILMVHNPHDFSNVDAIASFFLAYCSLSPAERKTLTLHYMQNARLPPGSRRDFNEQELFQEISKDYKTELARIHNEIMHGAPTTAPGASHGERRLVDKFLLVARNRAWIEQLNDVLLTTHLPFYAIGAKHFASQADGPGLIGLLRGAGFRVNTVQKRSDLDRLLSRIPTLPPKVQSATLETVTTTTLVGQCLRIPENYFCAWGAGLKFYTVTDRKNASKEELITLCYQRKRRGIPISLCTTASIPKPEYRHAELPDSRSGHY